jgi:hypothetical protein
MEGVALGDFGRHGLVERETEQPERESKNWSGDWRNWTREVRGIKREDREEPITHSNRLIERNWRAAREIGGGREEREEGAGREIGGQGQGKEREEIEGNRPGGPGESDWERRERGGSSSQASGDSSPWRSPLKGVALQPALRLGVEAPSKRPGTPCRL